MTSFLQDRVCCSGQFSIGGLRFAAGGRILGDQVSTHKLATCQLFYTLLLFFTFNSQTGLLRDPLSGGGLNLLTRRPLSGSGVCSVLHSTLKLQLSNGIASRSLEVGGLNLFTRRPLSGSGVCFFLHSTLKLQLSNGIASRSLEVGGLTCSPAVPFQGPGFVFPVIPPQASLVGLPEKTNPTLSRRAGFWVAEREGFEPSIPFRGIHTFQACSFNHSDTSPCLIREDKTTHLQVKSSRKRE